MGKKAIVIGSGAGGSMVARVLVKSQRFEKVTILEKGHDYFQGTLGESDFRNVKTTFSNDELKFGTRDILEPDSMLDPRSFRTTTDPTVPREIVGEVNSLPQTVGGGLNHADWKARRLRPADLKLQTLAERSGYDVSGSSVVDWPITYRDLEPFYTIAEQIIGVQGPDQLPWPFAPWRSKEIYPMPPGVPQYVALRLAKGARLLGLHPFPAPTGITSRPYDGRPPCNDCGFDGDFGCPIGAKGSPAVTSLRHAILAGAELLPESYAYQLNRNDRVIKSVLYYDAQGESHELDVNADDVVVLAASAIEDARLCLNSGLGTVNDNIGRNLMFHFQTITVGIFPERLHPHRGRTITHMWDDFAGPARLRDYAGFYAPRGGTVEMGGTQNVIDEGKNYPQGVMHKRLMRMSPTRDHLAALTMQGEDLPQLENRIDLDGNDNDSTSQLRDMFGVRAPRITYKNHPFELRASSYYLPIMLDVLKASGAIFVAPLGGDFPRGVLPPGLESNAENPAFSVVPASRHILGTLRMGKDPANDHSVTESNGKFHDLDNLYAADGSLFPTSGGMNPSLTIMALGYRVGCCIVDPEKNPIEVAKTIDPQ